MSNSLPSGFIASSSRSAPSFRRSFLRPDEKTLLPLEQLKERLTAENLTNSRELISRRNKIKNRLRLSGSFLSDCRWRAFSVLSLPIHDALFPPAVF
jgi:hypothetical protein